jgi:hypothetical protein
MRFTDKTAPWRSWLFLIATAAFVGTPITGALGEEKKLEIGKWYPTLEAGLALTQSAYSDNWAGGDKGSVVWTAILNSNLENQLNEKVNWSNTLKLAFGQTHQQRGDREWDKPEKSTDLVQFETIFRFTVGWHLDPYASGRFDSQFHDASDPDGRTLSLNPIVLKEAAGFARQFIKEEDRSLLTRVGFALRQTNRRLFVAPAPGGSTESEFTNDGGVEWVTDYKTKVLEDRVAWTSKLTLYQPVFYSEKSTLEDLTAEQLSAVGIDPDVADFTTVVDVDWENIFTTQITKIISVNLYVRWIYDKYDNSVPPKLDENGDLVNPADVGAAIRKAGQFKQTMAIGLTYRFL